MQPLVSQPTSEEVVSRVIHFEKLEKEARVKKLEAQNSSLVSIFKVDESYWKEKEESYLRIENWVRENRDKIPSWSVAGSLNYAMTLEEMKEAIKSKLKQMASSGRLITEESLSKSPSRDTFYCPDKIDHTLSRIWGADFLRSNLVGHQSLNAAEHFLVVDETKNEIAIQVWHNDYPYLSRAENARVIAKKIDGTEKAWSYRCSQKLDELKYRDFKDEGNIICDSNGIGWVVDTELKGFDPPELNIEEDDVLQYLKMRFKVLAGDQYHSLRQTFKISITELITNATQ